MKKCFIALLFLCAPLFAAPKTALIFGVTGQDGSYLAELLLDKGYIVHGVKRRSSSPNTQRLDHIYKEPQEKNRRFILHYGDVTDTANIFELLVNIKPDEVYNLAAQSHVQVSFKLAEYTGDVDAIGAGRILQAIRILGLTNTRFYQASSSEMYGLVEKREPQNEKTKFSPRSPYGAAKLYAHEITVNARDSANLFAVSGILFNHESPRRAENFVTRKITQGVAAIVTGMKQALYLGNLNASRDWGHAKDYVNAIWLMLQNDKPKDYVIASGETHTVREFVQLAFAHAGITIAFKGEGLHEVGYDVNTDKVLVRVDERYFRPAEVDFLLGDSSLARTELGWTPQYSFKALVADMMDHDLKEAKRQALARSKELVFDLSGKDGEAP